MSRPRLAHLLIVAGALAASCGAAFATGLADDGASPPPRGNSAVAQVEPDQAAVYGVLRRQQTEADRLPEAHRGFVDREMSDDNGAAPAFARRATTTPSGDPVYVIPGRGWLCTYVVEGEQGGGGCNRTGEALRGYLVGTSSPAPGITRIVGLVPDGVGEVTLRTKDGSTERAVPEDNAYVFETARLPQQVEWGGAVIPVHSPLEP